MNMISSGEWIEFWLRENWFCMLAGLCLGWYRAKALASSTWGA